MNDRENLLSHESGKIYAAVSTILSLVGLAGLLIGYFIGGSPSGHSIAGGTPVLRGSLMGVIIEIVRGSIPMPAVSPALGLVGYLPRALYFGVFLLVAAVCVSFVLSIAAALLPKYARTLCLSNGKMLLFSYGILFAGNLLLCALRAARLSADFIDLPIALTLLAVFAVLALIALADNPRKSAFSLLFFLLSAVAFCAFVIPDTPLLHDVNRVVQGGSMGVFKRIALIILCGIILVNLLISMIFLNSKITYRFDILRYGVQFLCIFILLCAYDPLNFLSAQPLSAVLLILTPMGAMCLAIFAESLLIAETGRRKRIRKKGALTVSIDDEEVPLNAS